MFNDIDRKIEWLLRDAEPAHQNLVLATSRYYFFMVVLAIVSIDLMVIATILLLR